MDNDEKNVIEATLSSETEQKSEIYVLTPENITTQKNHQETTNMFFKGIPELRKIISPFDLEPYNPILRAFKIPGIIFTAALGGWIIGKLSAKPFYLVIIGHLVYYYYTRQVKQYKASLYSKLNQIDRINNIPGYESVEWINYIIKRFWINIEAAISSEIHSATNQILKKNCPSFLKSIKLSEITLGTEPPIIEKVKFIDKADDIVFLEVALSFIPLQDTDIIINDKMKTHWNFCIQLNAVINNLISLPILLRNVTFAAAIRLEIQLKKEQPFLKHLKLQFIDVPEFDFVFIPLKICDFMDLPLLSEYCKNLFKKQVSNLAIEPNSININLETINQYSGKKIGIICIRIHNLISHYEGQRYISITADEKVIGKTQKQDGLNPHFNESFYAIIKDTTTTLNLTMHQEENQFGVIYLRNLNKHHLTEWINLTNDKSSSALQVTTMFYQKTSKFQKNSIITIKVKSVENILKKNASIKLLYNTYVIVKIVNNISKIIIDEFETKRIFASRNPVFNQDFQCFIKNTNKHSLHIFLMDDKDDSQIGNTVIHLNDFKDLTEPHIKFKLNGVDQGEVILLLSNEYIDIHGETSSDCNSTESTNISDVYTKINIKKYKHQPGFNSLKYNSIPAPINLTSDSTEISEKFPGDIPQSVKENNKIINISLPEMNIGIYNTEKQNSRMIELKEALQLTLISFTGKGSYFFVIETFNDIFKLPLFTTKINFVYRTVIPIGMENLIIFRLFKLTNNGDVIIGEVLANLDNCEENGNLTLAFDNLQAIFNCKTSPLTNIIKNNCYKFVQCRINQISNYINDLKYFDNNGMHYITEIYKRYSFILEGKNDLIINYIDSVKLLGKKKKGKIEKLHNINLGKLYKKESTKSLIANITMKTYGCNFPFISYFTYGNLEIHIIKVSNIEDNSDNRSIDPFVVTYLNKESIFKTQIKKKTLNPEFNESCEIEIEKLIDKIGFAIYNYNRMSANQMLSFTEFPLYNINPGYSKYEIKMEDALSGQNTKTTLTVLFNFTKI